MSFGIDSCLINDGIKVTFTGIRVVFSIFSANIASLKTTTVFTVTSLDVSRGL